MYRRMTPDQRAKSELLGLCAKTLRTRAHRRWSVERACSTPPRARSPEGRVHPKSYPRGWGVQFDRHMLLLKTVETQVQTPLIGLDPAESILLYRAGITAIVESIDRFDTSRGGRLAAPGKSAHSARVR